MASTLCLKDVLVSATMSSTICLTLRATTAAVLLPWNLCNQRKANTIAKSGQGRSPREETHVLDFLVLGGHVAKVKDRVPKRLRPVLEPSHTPHKQNKLALANWTR